MHEAGPSPKLTLLGGLAPDQTLPLAPSWRSVAVCSEGTPGREGAPVGVQYSPLSGGVPWFCGQAGLGGGNEALEATHLSAPDHRQTPHGGADPDEIRAP